MASGPFVDVIMTGDAHAARVFRDLPRKMQNNIMRRVLRGAAKKVEAVAESRIPVDTGTLKSAGLKVRALTGKQRRRGEIGYAIQTPEREQLGIDSDSKGYYPAHVEMGHKTPNGGHVPAVPFLRSTADEMRAGIIASIGSAVRVELGRIK